MALFRTRGAPSDGADFSPSKSNLYSAVKAIFHPATNAGVQADDTNKELDVAAAASGDPRLALLWSHNIAIGTARTLTRAQNSQATLPAVGAGEIWAAHVKSGDKRSPVTLFLASDLEALSAAQGDEPSNSNSIEIFISENRVGWLSKDSERRPLFADNDATVDPAPLSIYRLQAPAADGQSDGTVAWSDITGKPNFAAVATSGAYADLSGRPTIPDKASNTDVDGESDDADYMTVAKVFRAIARKVKTATSQVVGIVRFSTVAEQTAGTATNSAMTPAGVARYVATKVKNASATVRGIVLMARNEDVAATETDTSRVPTIANVKTLIARLAAGIGVSDEGSALTAALKSLNFVGDGVTVTEGDEGALTVNVPGGAAPPAQHTDFRFGVSDDAVPEASELSETSSNGRGTIASYDGTKRWLVARLASENDIASIVIASDSTAANLIGGFTKHGSAVDVGGTDYNVWVSNQPLSNPDGETLIVT